MGSSIVKEVSAAVGVLWGVGGLNRCVKEFRIPGLSFKVGQKVVCREGRRGRGRDEEGRESGDELAGVPIGVILQSPSCQL